MIQVEANIVDNRTVALQKLFEGVTNSKSPTVSRKMGLQVIYFLGPSPAIGRLRDSRHPTRVKDVSLNYFEIWDSVKGGKNYQLDKVYLHIDLPNSEGNGDDEILALHCDLNTLNHDISYKYKRGPHMHFPFGKFGLDRSHIALCLQHLDETCSDFDKFGKTFADILKMVDEEVLSRLQEHFSE